MIDRALVERVDLLCLDAGNTVVFLDHARIARFLESRGVEVELSELVKAEGSAKRGLAGDGSGEVVAFEWAHQGEPGGAEWGKVMGTILALGGRIPRVRVPELLAALWAEHLRFNLYSRVPEGLPAAVSRLRAAGVKVAIISNSEGRLAALFEELGILACFDRVVDSGVVGVAKPDPRIFTFATEAFGISPDRALHLGDTFATDVAGARAAGIRTALLDPFLHYPGLYPDVPRVDSVEQVADAIVDLR
ncbi:HAD-IA family hydrolase [Pendulispora rubella]|uniref:HAD-IA family hydrolase n=1 Tax=Pendulispora rubella TaxID=2741070 RepID=A0ABZ2L155_9BACT